MFEKEAEEYRIHFENELYLFDNTDIFPNNIEEAYQKGAIDGYNKANEWHYNEVPNNENDILCQISKDEAVVGYYHTVAKRYFTIDGQDIYNVIAWKEIVLPELPKEIE